MLPGPNNPHPDDLGPRPDEQIAREVAGGRADLFGLLVQRYEGRMRAYGYRFLSSREDIEDQVQEVFLKAYQNLRDFDPRRRFSPWIYRIAHNTFVNALRTKKRRPLIFFDGELFLPRVRTDHPENDLDRAELRRLLELGVDQLDPKYKEPLILYYFDELSYQDISDVLRIPTSTVGIRISRGRDQLRKYINSLAKT